MHFQWFYKIGMHTCIIIPGIWYQVHSLHMALHLRRLTNILMAGERTRRARHCCTGYDHIAVHCYYSVRRTPSCAFFSSLISGLMASYRHHPHQRHHHQVIQAAREETRNCVVVFAGRAQWTLTLACISPLAKSVG